MSGINDTPQINNKKSRMRITPSTALNATCLPKMGYAFFSFVAATSGTNLYSKIKKPTEKMILSAATHPLISVFLAFSP